MHVSISVLPGPVCSVWPAGNAHREDPLSRLGNGTEGMSSSDLRCQMWSGRKDPWVPNICVSAHRGKEKQTDTQMRSTFTTRAEDSIIKIFKHKSQRANFFHYLDDVPLVSHPRVEPGRVELGLLGTVSGIHDLVVLICPIKKKWHYLK